MADPTNAQIASQIHALLTKWNEREAQLRAWLAGSVLGGPNGDGRYPLSNATGDVQLISSPAKLADIVEGPAGLAGIAKVSAEAAAALAAQHSVEAMSQADIANSAKLTTIDARDLAKMYRDDAASSAATAQVHRQAAEAARDETINALAQWRAENP